MSKTEKTSGKSCPAFRTMVGGQAVIEGVMMRGKDKAAVAVRKTDGSIAVEQWSLS